MGPNNGRVYRWQVIYSNGWCRVFVVDKFHHTAPVDCVRCQNKQTVILPLNAFVVHLFHSVIRSRIHYSANGLNGRLAAVFTFKFDRFKQQSRAYTHTNTHSHSGMYTDGEPNRNTF